MKLRLVLSATALAFTAIAANPVFAQMNMDHSKMGMAGLPSMTDGEVRKIDKENQKITLKHGDIKNLDMPGMTMVFKVKDAAMLDKVQVGSKVRFKAEKSDGAIVVTSVELAQ